MERGNNIHKEKESNKSNWIQYFLAPLLTAGFIFLLQFLFQPGLENKKTMMNDIYIQKKEACIKAASLVAEKYQTLKFNESDTSKRLFDNYIEVNNVYFSLLLYCDNEKIAAKFWPFFNSKTSRFTPSDRGEFIALLKKELIGKDLSTPVDSIPILKSPKAFIK